MPRDERLFGDVVVPSISIGSRQRTSVTLTILLETLAVGVLVSIPVMATDVLPAAPDMMGAFVAAQPPPPVPPPPPPAASRPRVMEEVRHDAAPTEAPRDLAPEQAPVDNRFELGGPGTPGGVDGVTGGVEGGHGFDVPPPPPAAPAPREPVPVGGRIQAPKKIRDVKPVYPPIAQSARVQGFVILEATIGTHGKVTDVRVIRSEPLLDQAAIDAVRQWEFTPTLLNGEPIAIIMNVTVHFRLN